jgi:hypothetical protein
MTRTGGGVSIGRGYQCVSLPSRRPAYAAIAAFAAARFGFGPGGCARACSSRMSSSRSVGSVVTASPCDVAGKLLSPPSRDRRGREIADLQIII